MVEIVELFIFLSPYETILRTFLSAFCSFILQEKIQNPIEISPI